MCGGGGCRPECLITQSPSPVQIDAASSPVTHLNVCDTLHLKHNVSVSFSLLTAGLFSKPRNVEFFKRTDNNMVSHKFSVSSVKQDIVL